MIRRRTNPERRSLEQQRRARQNLFPRGRRRRNHNYLLQEGRIITLVVGVLAVTILATVALRGSLSTTMPKLRKHHGSTQQRHHHLLVAHHNVVKSATQKHPYSENKRVHRPTAPLDLDFIPDYDEIHYTKLTTGHFARTIQHDEWEDQNSKGRLEAWDARDYDPYYDFDDDYYRNTYIWLFEHEWHDERKGRQCREPSFRSGNPLNCNTFHEVNLLSGDHLGLGAYRTTYMLQEDDDTKSCLKLFRLDTDKEFNIENRESIRMEAVIAEQVSRSPLTVHNFGFCQLSVLSEFIPGGTMEDLAQRPDGVYESLDQEHPKKMNDITPGDKLWFALQMAEGLRVLHGNKEGVIVHDDMWLAQYLLTEDKKNLKLNDFNRGEVMQWNEKDQEYCKYTNGPGQGDWRAPEEFKDERLDEKIDIFGLGNNFFTLVTGVWPFYEEGSVKDKVKQKWIIKDGMTDTLYERYKGRTFAEDKIIEIMPRMFEYKPEDRIDIFELTTYLQDAWAEHQHRDGNSFS